MALNTSRSWSSFVRKFYRESLIKSQNNPRKVFIFSIIVIAVSLVLFQVIQKELAPTEDRGVFIIVVSTPEGSTLDYTDNIVKQVEEYLVTYKENNEIKKIICCGGAWIFRSAERS